MNCVEMMKIHPEMQLTVIALNNGFSKYKIFLSKLLNDFMDVLHLHG
mgnify:CR=1 FL=1